MSRPRPSVGARPDVVTSSRPTGAAAGPAEGRPTSCRACGGGLHQPVVDLGAQPVRRAPLARHEVERPEPFRPLRLFVCERCALVQLAGKPSRSLSAEPEAAPATAPAAAGPGLSEEEAVDLIERLGLRARRRVVLVGSGTGTQLDAFAQRGVATLGLEPSPALAARARGRGIPTVVERFDAASAARVADQVGKADLLLTGEALARADDLHDVAAGIRSLLARDGVALVDLLDLERVVSGARFDLLEHGRPSLPSLTALRRILGAHALEMADVEQVSDEAGESAGRLRVHVRHVGRGDPPAAAVERRLELEQGARLERVETWQAFEERARAARRRLLQLLVRARESGRTVAAWGSSGGLLDACGARADLVAFAVDPEPALRGGVLPGSRVPIVAPDELARARPDYVLLLSADGRVEAARALAGIEAWGGRLVVATPDVDVFTPRLVLEEPAAPAGDLRIGPWSEPAQEAA